MALTAGKMVHYCIKAADIAEDEIEYALRDDTLHQTDEVLGKWDALVFLTDGCP